MKWEPMSYYVELHSGGGEIDGEKVDMDLSFTGGSMCVFLQSLNERSNIRASYRLPLGTLRVLKKLLDEHLDIYAAYETGQNGEVTGRIKDEGGK